MKMMDYINEQPAVLREILDKRKNVAEVFCRKFSDIQPDVIYLIASGTSWNAAKAAAPFMEMVLNQPVFALPPSRIGLIWGRKPMVLLISQGGKSTNILAAAEKTSEYSQIAMTGSSEGKLNTLCDAYIPILCGEENVGPKTKGYTATILTLYVMALEAAKKTEILKDGTYAEYMDMLTSMINQLPENIKRVVQWTEQNEDNLKELKTLYFVGKRQGMDIASEGALKVMETLLIPGMAFDFEEYLHGPSCSIEKNVGGFYLFPEKSDEDYERMAGLAKHHKEICSQVYAVVSEENGDKRSCFVAAAGVWYTQPFEQILPFQVLSALIPEKLGIEGVGMQRFKALDGKLNVKYKEG